MVEFNLLPWRKIERRYQLRIVIMMCLGALAVAVLLSYLAHEILSAEIQTLLLKEKAIQSTLLMLQQKENHFMKTVEFKKLVNLPTRPNLANIFVALNKAAHPGVCFQTLTYQNNNVGFSGYVLGIDELTVFLKKRALVDVFSEIHVEKMITTSSSSIQFQLQAVVTK